MGKFKFRFSDMIPNAWFHKLKYMSSSSSSGNKPTSKPLNPKHPSASSMEINHHTSDHRTSYYFSRDPTNPALSVVEPPRNSSRRRRSTKRIRQPPRHVSTAVSASGCSCRATVESVSPPSPEERGPDQSSSSGPDSVLTEYGSGAADSMASSTPCKCGDKNDIIIDINVAGGGEDRCRRLAPIITKPATDRLPRKSTELSEARRYPAKPSASPGMRLRVNSPRIANRRVLQGRRSSASRRSIGESFAVVKASKDPRRDFRESMVEMIMENKIKASKDLEELLACYLSLNSDQYHDLIISVFKQIWFDFIHVNQPLSLH